MYIDGRTAPGCSGITCTRPSAHRGFDGVGGTRQPQHTSFYYSSFRAGVRNSTYSVTQTELLSFRDAEYVQSTAAIRSGDVALTCPRVVATIELLCVERCTPSVTPLPPLRLSLVASTYYLILYLRFAGLRLNVWLGVAAAATATQLSYN